MKVYIVHEENDILTTFFTQEDVAKYAEFYNLKEYFIEEIKVFSWAEYQKLFIVR